MSLNLQQNNLPLPLVGFRSVKFKLPTHEIESPELPGLPPERIFQTVDKPSIASSGATQIPLPSVPSYATQISASPAMLSMSLPARVLFRGNELEPFTIFQPDGRRLYDDRTYPWRCVCKVTSGMKSGCGVLIGPRHVLTASHVIDWQANSDSVSLIQNGITLATAFSTHVISFEQISDVTYNNADDDYAVIVLATRLGDNFGWLGSKEYDSAWDNETANWINIAYAPDMSGNTPMFQTGFFLDEDDFDLGGGRMLTTKTGDFVKGMSGSPIFGFWSEGPFVVGVTSAGGSGLGNFNAIAGGGNLPKLVSIARTDFP